MALLDFDQPYQYGSVAKAALGQWNTTTYYTSNLPRSKTAWFKAHTFKILGSGDGSLAPGDSTAIVGGRFFNGAVGINVGILGIREDTQYQCSVSVNADGTLSVYRGYPLALNEPVSILLQTSTFAMATDVKYFIEFEVLLHQTAGWYKVYVDNVVRIDSVDVYPSGVDTCGMGTTTWDGWNPCIVRYFQQDAIYCTDLYAMDGRDGTGLTPAQPYAYNTPLGDVKVDFLSAVAGNGTYTDWGVTGAADRGEALDDTEDGTAINGDTDYVSSMTSGHRVSVALDNLSSTDVTILAVAPSNAMTKDNAGNVEVKPGHYISGGGANPYMGTAVQVPAQGSYGVRKEMMFTNPYTTAAWTATQVNSNEAVIEVV